MGPAPLVRVVLDSNILFSALISPGGAPSRIVRAWRGKRFVLVTCPTRLEEVRRASRYAKFASVLQPHHVGEIVNALRATLGPDPPPSRHDLPDPDDAWLLSLAEAGVADWLVTGDRRSGLLSLRRVGRARITTASAFADLVDPRGGGHGTS